MGDKGIKIKFNNFKPFDENYQTITKKPITLVYGPNSAGKSSLIDALMYYENLQSAHLEELSDPDYLNVKNKYFAGDAVDLGGFKNIVHQKDTTRKINYVATYNDRGHFKKFIPGFEEIEELLNAFLNEYSDNYLGNNYDYIEKRLRENDEKKQEGKEQKNDSLNKVIKSYAWFLVNSTSRRKMFHLLLRRDSNQNIDYSSQAHCVDSYISYLIDGIMGIESIKIQNEVACDESGKLYTKLYFLINDKIVFDVKFGKFKTYYEVYNHSIFSQLIEIDKKKNSIIHFGNNNTFKFNMFVFPSPFIFSHLRSSDNYLKTIVLEIMHQIQTNKSVSAVQYIGPLRLIPSKSDLFQSSTNKKNNNKRTKEGSPYSGHQKIQSYIKNNYFYKLLFLSESIEKFLSEIISKITNSYLVKKIKVVGEYVESLEKKIKNIQNIVIKYITWTMYGLFMFLPATIVLTVSVLVYVAALLALLVVLLVFIILLLPPSLLIIIWKYANNLSILLRKHIAKIKSIFLGHVSLSTLGAVTTEKMWSDFVASEEIQKKINNWLGNEKMKTQYEVHIETKKPNWLGKLFGKKEKKQLSFLDKRSSTIVYPNEMGTGISQVLPILIASKIRHESTIFIEQPELHLHPALQSELADEFISSAKKRKNDFFIETHSEHLLLRMMKRMKQTSEGTLKDKKHALRPEDINLLYVDTNKGKTFILELELDEDGTLLDPWPGGFFEEGFNERFF